MIYDEPSYLTGLVTPVTNKLLLEIQKEYGDYSTAFKFNENFESIEQTWFEDFECYGGTVWGIVNAKNRILIFDQFKHGYNGEMKVSEAEDLAIMKRTDLAKGIEIIIAFQYSGDEAEHVETGASKFEKDYFSWVIVYKYSNNQLEEIFSYECA